MFTKPHWITAFLGSWVVLAAALALHGQSKTEVELRRQVEVARAAAAASNAAAFRDAAALAAMRKLIAEQQLAAAATRDAKRTAATDAVAALAKASEILLATQQLVTENAKAALEQKASNQRREEQDGTRDYILKLLAAVGAPAILLAIVVGALGFAKFTIEQRSLHKLVVATKADVADTKSDIAAVKVHTNGMMAILNAQAKTEGHAEGRAEAKAESSAAMATEDKA